MKFLSNLPFIKYSIYFLIGAIGFIMCMIFYHAIFEENLNMGIKNSVNKVSLLNGNLNISDWDFSESGVLFLNGNWKYKWNADSPDFSDPDYNDNTWGVINPYKEWKNQTGSMKGHGWLRSRITGVNKRRLCLYSSGIMSSYELYVNGEKLIKIGNPGNSRKSTIPKQMVTIADMPETDSYLIAIKIANYYSSFGGFSTGIALGTIEQISDWFANWRIYFSFFIGFVFMIGLFNLLLWIVNPDEKYCLTFAIVSFLYVLNFLCDGELIQLFFPKKNLYLISILLGNLSNTFLIYFLSQFFFNLFPKEFSKNILRIILVVLCLFGFAQIIIPPWIEGFIRTHVYFFFAIVFCWLIYSLSKAIYYKRKESGLMLICLILLFIPFIIDFLLPVIGIRIEIETLGIFEFIIFLFQGIVIARRYSRAATTAKYLTQNLKKEVEIKTQALKIEHKKLLTEQARYHEERMIQADRLVALGTLVASVAHEINNPNNANLMGATILKQTWNNLIPVLDKTCHEQGDFNIGKATYSQLKNELSLSIQYFRDNCEQIKWLVQELKQFAREKKYSQPQAVDINEIINGSIHLLEHQIHKASNSFQIKLRTHLPLCLVHPHKIKQVIINLIQNSCQALTSKNQAILISTDYNTENKKISITVSDEGKGMDNDTLSNIFKPFFTTRETSGGTGLGLFVCKKIINQYDGDLILHSSLNKGTTAMIYLQTIEENNNGISESIFDRESSIHSELISGKTPQKS